jgi:hypothetical protein
MMANNHRDTLLSLMARVRPALSNQSYIPAWTHIQLAGGFATTYNDLASISVRLPDTGLPSCCVPGDLFIKALGSIKADQVLVQEHATEKAIVVSAGKARMKLPVLPATDFSVPQPRSAPASIQITDDILDAIKQCLLSVGTDPTHPTQMGVTLDSIIGTAVLYSTDNITISRCVTKTPLALPGDAPVILPTFFCEQLLSLATAYPKDNIQLDIYPGMIRALFDKGHAASIMHKMVVELEPLDFEAIIAKYLSVSELPSKLQPVPVSFDSAWTRALLVLNGSSDKSTKVQCNGTSVDLLTTSSLGQSEDVLTLEKAGSVADFYIDPALVLRAAKSCTQLAFYKKVMVMAGTNVSFIHLIAHCAA